MWNCNEKGFVSSNKSLPTATELFQVEAVLSYRNQPIDLQVSIW